MTSKTPVAVPTPMPVQAPGDNFFAIGSGFLLGGGIVDSVVVAWGEKSGRVISSGSSRLSRKLESLCKV